MTFMWTCGGCGAVNGLAVQECEYCGRAKGKHAAPAEDTKGRPNKPCAVCGEKFQFWTSLTRGEDSAARCTPCHIEYLRKRAAGTTRETRCTEPGCTKTVGEHIAEGKAFLARINERITSPR